jgi:gliding motility associated protien GldN
MIFSVASLRTALAVACLCAPWGAALFAQTDPAPQPAGAPLDDFTTRYAVAERAALPYAPVREADIMWEKRLWRVIDVREKMNQPFTYPEAPLFGLMMDAALAGTITAYSTEDERFSTPIVGDDLRGLFFKRDTVMTINVETGEEEVRMVENRINWENVKRFRMKEAWFFNKHTGTLQHRILGIAPMIDVLDEDGNFLYERPLFWMHYASARSWLARQKAYLPGDNYAATTTWEDLLERRQFASVVIKENNPHDRRLQDYLSGVDLLHEATHIKDDLFNREHDLWTW